MSLCNGGCRRLVVVLICIFVFAACGDLPRPFQPTKKSVPDIAEEWVSTHAGVFVQPIFGLEMEESERLNQTLVETLSKEEVAASRFVQNRASLRISAHPTENGRLHWFLTAPNGETLLGFDEAGDQAGTRRAARLFADFLNLPPPPAAASLVLGVLAVDGAPGDGRGALADAMRQALIEKGFVAADGLEEATYLVLGSVHVTAARSVEQDRVNVDWIILAQDGARLGTVSQSNHVAAGTLDGRWGAAARIVAENGAQGIVSMLTRLGVLE